MLEIAEQEVDVEAALVRLVDDQGVVVVQKAVALDLGEQDAIGHQLDRGLGAHPVMEAHLVADRRPEFGAEFLRDPAGEAARGDAPGLGMTDAAEDAPAEFEADLRQLGRFTGAGLAAQDNHLVIADQCGDLVAALADR